jgi:hypothetical protein
VELGLLQGVIHSHLGSHMLSWVCYRELSTVTWEATCCVGSVTGSYPQSLGKPHVALGLLQGVIHSHLGSHILCWVCYRELSTVTWGATC